MARQAITRPTGRPDPPPYQPDRDLIGYIEKGQKLPAYTRAESWLTWLAMKYLGRRGYACHVGLCRDWLEMDGLRVLTKPPFKPRKV